MALQVGDKIPHFSAKDSHDNNFDSASVVGKKPIVIYFYPKDNTPGCISQACSFRDQYEEFKDLGAEVIGISSDSVQSHKKFTNQYKLPFILLSDNDKKLRKFFGVKTSLLGLMPGRVTFVVDKEGVLQLVFDSIIAKSHIPKALAIIKNLQKNKPI